MDFKEQINAYAGQPLTWQLLSGILKDYKRPYDKLDELVKQNILIQVKRGFYIPSAQLNVAQPEPFLLANHLYGPSYVTSDSALFYYGLIPEQVFEVTSVTSDAAKNLTTPVGRFSYLHLPLPYYSFGIKHIALTTKQTVLMASEEKALCDKIVTTSGMLLRSVKQTTGLLLLDLRMDSARLRDLDHTIISSWLHHAPKKNSLHMLVKALAKL